MTGQLRDEIVPDCGFIRLAASGLSNISDSHFVPQLKLEAVVVFITAAAHTNAEVLVLMYSFCKALTS